MGSGGSSDKTDGGAIAGIIIGCVALTAMIVVAGYYVYQTSRTSDELSDN